MLKEAAAKKPVKKKKASTLGADAEGAGADATEAKAATGNVATASPTDPAAPQGKDASTEKKKRKAPAKAAAPKKRKLTKKDLAPRIGPIVAEDAMKEMVGKGVASIQPIPFADATQEAILARLAELGQASTGTGAKIVSFNVNSLNAALGRTGKTPDENKEKAFVSYILALDADVVFLQVVSRLLHLTSIHVIMIHRHQLAYVLSFSCVFACNRGVWHTCWPLPYALRDTALAVCSCSCRGTWCVCITGSISCMVLICARGVCHFT